MTELQMKHMGLVEDHRANLINEELRARDLAETRRSNLAREEETERANRAREEDTDLTLAETTRANKAREGLQLSTLEETTRSNMARESESERSNKAREADAALNTQIRQEQNLREAELHPGELKRQEAELEKTYAQTSYTKADTQLKTTTDRAMRYEKLGDFSGVSENLDASTDRSYREQGLGKTLYNGVVSGILNGVDLIRRTINPLSSSASALNKMIK